MRLGNLTQGQGEGYHHLLLDGGADVVRAHVGARVLGRLEERGKASGERCEV